MAVEPLTITLQSSLIFQGITREGGVNNKVPVYADDLLLFVSQPSISIPHILTVLDSFGKISDYKLNLDKSEVFPVNEAARSYLLSSLSFKMVSSGSTYLGVNVTD